MSRTVESPAFLLEEEMEEEIGSPSEVPDEIEEAVMVAFDRSGEGGELRIVTDPNEIRNIEIEEQERKRNVSTFFTQIIIFRVILNRNEDEIIFYLNFFFCF